MTAPQSGNCNLLASVVQHYTHVAIGEDASPLGPQNPPGDRESQGTQGILL